MALILQELIDKGIKLTPMMEQYYSIKKNYPETLLLFRMGDFYELFFDDAIEAAKILNISLTHRGKLAGVDIPMSGIPHHAANTYIDRITSKGLKAAICEQIENPKEAKGIVKRAVTQIVGPGMPYDLEKTISKQNYYISCGFKANEKYYLISIDFTTGKFIGQSLATKKDFLEKIQTISPKELVSYMGQWNDYPEIDELIVEKNILKTHLSEEYFKEKFTSVYIEKIFPNYKSDKIISTENKILNPIGAICYYICTMRPTEKLTHINPFKFESEMGKMKTTLSTLRGLEILPRDRDSYKLSLLGHFDKTKTAMGARALRHSFLSPITSMTLINKRLNLVEVLSSKDEILHDIRIELEKIRDIERIMAKLSTGKANGSDLINISKAIYSYQSISKLLPKILKKELINSKLIDQLIPIADEIKKFINEEIGATLDKGNLINSGVNKKRDRLADLSFNTGARLKELEKKYREETAIPKLRVKSNNVAGYFIEISKGQTDKAPAYFRRKQTLTNSERYLTKELTELEKEILSARDKLLKIEREIFNKITNSITSNAIQFQQLANKISNIDIIQNHSWMAIQDGLTRPHVTTEKIFQVTGGWHPLIKANIKDLFVSHDIKLDENNFFGLITGPNMAGKTTVMREVAIIQLLAQIGSFVPAQKATIGICDYLFSRLGASDDILRGQSTFMVEMTETAEILRHATDRSLIILDEIGRGTSTYDGLSIAWALVEMFVKKIKARTLFATHYHELIDVVNDLPGAKNLTVETKSSGDNVQFLYRLIETSAAQSFGIYVAKLAGIPSSILNRSSQILKNLEDDRSDQKPKKIEQEIQLSLFDNTTIENKQEIPEHLLSIEKIVKEIDLANTTPINALIKLQEVQTLIQ